MKARLQALLARRLARATAIVIAFCGTVAAVYAFAFACVIAAAWMDEHYALPVSFQFVELAAIVLASAIGVAASVTRADAPR